MEAEIRTIYDKTDNIILKHIIINDIAMKLSQSWGYNGFKRLHRINSRKLLNEHLKLENDMFDKYRAVLHTDMDKKIEYSPSNIKYQLNQLKEVFEQDIKELGNLNCEHIKLVGISNDVIECIIKIFMHDYEKVCRWIARFNECSWNSIDIHLVDDRLHEKMKAIEEG